MAASPKGKVIACLESRMRSEMAAMIERYGGTPYPAPVLEEAYLLSHRLKRSQAVGLPSSTDRPRHLFS